MRRSPARPLVALVYAAFIGLLLASYAAPLREIPVQKDHIAHLEADLEELEKNNAEKRRLAGELTTPEGIEKAARQRYGMIKPGEKAYIVE